MGFLRQGWNRVRAFFRKGPLDADLDAEMASHLEMAVEENLRRGMAVEEARRRAMARFGGVQQAREKQRAARGLPFVDVLGQDLRYTLRTLGRDAGFTVVAVLILGLGIGANVAVFSVVNTLLLRPLPFPDAGKLVRITTVNPPCGESCRTYSADATRELQERNRSFERVSGYFAFTSADNYKLMGRAVPLPVTGILVDQSFFQTLGVQPVLGRLFLPEECLHSARPTVLLSYPFWKRQFGGKRDIVGQAVDFNGTPVTVVGVLPDTFDFGSVFSPGAKVDISHVQATALAPGHRSFEARGDDGAGAGRGEFSVPQAGYRSEASGI